LAPDLSAGTCRGDPTGPRTGAWASFARRPGGAARLLYGASRPQTQQTASGSPAAGL